MRQRTSILLLFLAVTLAALVIFWILPESEPPAPEELLDGQPDIGQLDEEVSWQPQSILVIAGALHRAER